MLRPPPISTLFPYTTLFRSTSRRHPHTGYNSSSWNGGPAAKHLTWPVSTSIEEQQEGDCSTWPVPPRDSGDSRRTARLLPRRKESPSRFDLPASRQDTLSRKQSRQ